MINTVDITKVEKDLRKLPRHILENLRTWVRIIKLEGLEASRLVKGYHDEPLKGKRAGQRSIRLSRSYRAIYSLRGSTIQVVFVEEVNKHEY
jgi:proteic killer suppression protein